MTRDIETLTQIIKWALYVAAFFTTAFPVLYAFAPWWSTTLGRLLMFMTLSFAVIMDVTVLFQFWEPTNILVIFWIEAICFALVALSTGLLTGVMVRMNFNRWRKESDEAA